jgi:hypothetical protein
VQPVPREHSVRPHTLFTMSPLKIGRALRRGSSALRAPCLTSAASRTTGAAALQTEDEPIGEEEVVEEQIGEQEPILDEQEPILDAIGEDALRRRGEDEQELPEEKTGGPPSEQTIRRRRHLLQVPFGGDVSAVRPRRRLLDFNDEDGTGATAVHFCVCKQGFFAESNGVSCSACPTGSNKTALGASECGQCPADTYADNEVCAHTRPPDRPTGPLEALGPVCALQQQRSERSRRLILRGDAGLVDVHGLPQRLHRTGWQLGALDLLLPERVRHSHAPRTLNPSSYRGSWRSFGPCLTCPCLSADSGTPRARAVASAPSASTLTTGRGWRRVKRALTARPTPRPGAVPRSNACARQALPAALGRKRRNASAAASHERPRTRAYSTPPPPPPGYSGTLLGSPCQICPAGTYKGATGTGVCTQCDPGLLSDQGAASCTGCPVTSTYADVDGSGVCVCDAGFGRKPSPAHT